MEKVELDLVHYEKMKKEIRDLKEKNKKLKNGQIVIAFGHLNGWMGFDWTREEFSNPKKLNEIEAIKNIDMRNKKKIAGLENEIKKLKSRTIFDFIRGKNK